MTATTTTRAGTGRHRELTELPLGPVLAVAAVHLALLLAVAGRYGYHRDEVYFLEAGRHLDWGYVDQPPFTPLVARLATAVFGSSLVGLRLLPALATTATVVVGALIVRELGGSRWAQVVGAGAVAASGFVLGVGHLLSTATFDWAAWLVLLAIGVRLARTGDPRWWLAFGTVAGLALWNKHLVVLLAMAFVAGLVLDRRWELLRTRWLLWGGAIAIVLALPNLVWQAANDWPQLEMAEAIAERIGGENRALLIPGQLYLLGPLLVPLIVAGAWWLARSPEARPFRPMLWAWPVALMLTFASAGRPYYPLPLTLVMVLAGVAAAGSASVGVRRASVALVVVNGLGAVPLALPVLPADTLADVPVVNEELVETVGWPELADTIEEVVEALPPAEREHVVVLARTYGEAGALDRFGPERGLPAVYSGHNAYGEWRQPPEGSEPVVTVRYAASVAEQYFDECEQVATVENAPGIDNGVAGEPVLVCRGLRGTWDELWPSIRFLS